MRSRVLSLTAIAAALACAGCASAKAPSGPKQSPIASDSSRSPKGQRASLTVSYFPRGMNSGRGRVWHLTCSPSGGSHPRRQQACRELALHADLLGPVRRPCTKALLRRGVPETYVTGRIGNRQIVRLVRPVCDGAAWASLHVLLTGA